MGLFIVDCLLYLSPQYHLPELRGRHQCDGSTYGAPIAGSTLRSDRQGSAKTLDKDPHRPKDLGKYPHTEAQGAQRKKKQKD